MDPHHLELLDELGPNAGGLEAALDLALDDPGLLEDEHVLHDDHVAFHALNLGDVDDLARSVLEAALLEDQVYRRLDLLADRPNRPVDDRPEYHRLDSREHFAGTACVAARHRAVMAPGLCPLQCQ